MRKHIVAGNWKMNKSFADADDLLNSLMEELEKIELPRDEQVIVCPPALYLEMASDYANDSYFSVGAQDVSTHTDGAYTGEISAAMLASCELEFCIVGHSERRMYHGETDADIAAKVDQLLAENITPIVCCGEVKEEREAGKQFEVVSRQIENGLFHLQADKMAKIVIAYEPVWAIGTGLTATPDQAQEMHAHIRHLVEEKYGKNIADEISILYGGSCKPSNAREIFSKPDVDGGLIGGASLVADDFVKIITSF